MQKSKTFWHALVMFLVGVFAVTAFTTPLAAKDENLMFNGLNMMMTGVSAMEDGIKAMNKGIAMNDQAAGDQASLLAAGDKIIKDGQQTLVRGAALFDEGEAMYLKNKKDVKVANAAGKMVIDGLKIAKDGVVMIAKGMDMNNKVAQDKGFAGMLEPGNKVLIDGLKMFGTGEKEFAQGEAIYLKNK